MEQLVNTHVHCIYSVYDSTQTPQEIINKIAEIQQPAVALTDHGAFGGLYQFQNAALKAGIKPLLGTEWYVTDSLVQEKENRAGRHLVMIAKNKRGWENLCEISWIGAQTDHFYYKPRITYDELFSHKEGLIISSACLAGPMAKLFTQNKLDEAEKMFNKFVDEFKDDFYAEIQIHPIKEQLDYNNWLIDIANRNGVPIILTADAHYSNQQDSVVQKLMFQIRSDDISEEGEFSNDLYLHTIQDYKNRNSSLNFGLTEEQIEQYCSNTVYLADKVDFLIPQRTKAFLPPQATDEFKVLQELSIKGLQDYFKTDYDNCPVEYRQRLEKELQLIWKKGMSRYLLCLRDMVLWSKNNYANSTGPGRGSFLGSLTGMCLGISSWKLDPLKNNLLFERFVSEARLPSCMIDYSEE